MSDEEKIFTLRRILLCAAIILLSGTVMGMAIFTADYFLNPAPENAPEGLDMSQGAFLAVFLAQNAAIFLGLWLAFIKTGGCSWADLGWRKTTRFWILAGLAAGIACYPLSQAVESIMEDVLEVSFDNLAIELYAPFGFSWTAAIAMIAIGGIVAPIAEELFFRGVLYRWLCRFTGTIPAMLLSSAAFAAVHFQLAVMPQIFLIGILLAWLYQRSGSLYPAILAHGVVNTISFVKLFTVLYRLPG